MTDNEASNICTLYGFDPAKAGKAFVSKAKDYSEAVRVALEGTSVEMKACMQDRVGNLIKFANFLGGDSFGNNPAEPTSCLIAVNKMFDTQWVEIAKEYDNLEINVAIVEMYDTSKQWAPSIQNFAKELHGKGLHAILTGRRSFGQAGVSKTEIYELIQYFHDKKIAFAKLALSATNDRGQRIRNINRYRLAAPALTAFAGISARGPGDADDKNPKTDLRNHMLKHVLDDDQKKDAKALEWVGGRAGALVGAVGNKTDSC